MALLAGYMDFRPLIISRTLGMTSVPSSLNEYLSFKLHC